MKGNNLIIIKRIPGDWFKLNKDIYILYLGETDNEAGRRVIIPFREKLTLNPEYSAKVSCPNNLWIGKTHFKSFRDGLKNNSGYDMKLTGNYSNSKRWEVEINERDYKLLWDKSISPSDLVDFYPQAKELEENKYKLEETPEGIKITQKDYDRKG